MSRLCFGGSVGQNGQYFGHMAMVAPLRTYYVQYTAPNSTFDLNHVFSLGRESNFVVRVSISTHLPQM